MNSTQNIKTVSTQIRMRDADPNMKKLASLVHDLTEHVEKQKKEIEALKQELDSLQV